MIGVICYVTQEIALHVTLKLKFHAIVVKRINEYLVKFLKELNFHVKMNVENFSIV